MSRIARSVGGRVRLRVRVRLTVRVRVRVSVGYRLELTGQG